MAMSKSKSEANGNETTQRLFLRKRLFDDPVEDGEVSPDEVGNYLRLSARSRQTFCHYTSLWAANKIFGGKRLWLTRMDLLNDMKECQGNQALRKRTYVASFSATSKESVAMWWMYGLAGQEEKPDDKADGECHRVPVRLVLRGVALREAIKECQKDGAVQAEPNTQSEGTGKRWSNNFLWNNLPLKVARIDFFDVLYISHPRTQWAKNGKRNYGQIFWNGKQASRRRFKKELKKDAATLEGCLKDLGWGYEEETRIAIVLDESEAEKCKILEHISIPFEAALKDAELYVGPGRYAPEWHMVCKKDFKHAKELKSKKVLKSEYEIKFRKDS